MIYASLQYLASQRLFSPFLGFAFQTPLLGGASGAGWKTFFRTYNGGLDHIPQPMERFLPVLLSTPVVLCFDNNHSISADTPIIETK